MPVDPNMTYPAYPGFPQIPQGADPEMYCNITLCPLVLGQVEYIPTLAGNALYAAIFGILLVAQLFFGIRYKTWGFMGGMLGGVLLELIGYIARIQLHDNPFKNNPFLM